MPLDLGPKSAAYLERLRQNYCRQCKLSFVCLMGRPQRETFWCRKCKGWWLAEDDIFVRCDGFPGMHTGHYFARDRHGIAPRRAAPDSRATIDGCPLCDPQGENPMDIIEGLVEEREP